MTYNKRVRALTTTMGEMYGSDVMRKLRRVPAKALIELSARNAEEVRAAVELLLTSSEAPKMPDVSRVPTVARTVAAAAGGDANIVREEPVVVEPAAVEAAAAVEPEASAVPDVVLQKPDASAVVIGKPVNVAGEVDGIPKEGQ